MKGCFGCAKTDGSVTKRRASDSMLLAVLTCSQCGSATYPQCESSSGSDLDAEASADNHILPKSPLNTSVKPILDYRCTPPFPAPLFILRRLVHPSLNAERRRENCLHIWIQEAKGLTDKHRYHCEILLDEMTYARTTSKRLTDMLFWGEEFDLSGLPEFDHLYVQLWQDSNRPSSDGAGLPRPHTISPPIPRTASSAPSPHIRTSHLNTNPTGGSVQSPIPTRKTNTTVMMSCARGSNELSGTDDTVGGAIGGDHQNAGDLRYLGGTPEDAGRVRVLRERSGNVTTNLKQSGQSKSAPVRRRAARRGKIKSHKHCTEAQLVAFVCIPAAKLNGSTEVESWYPALLCDSSGRSKRPTEAMQHSVSKHKGSQKHSSGTSNQANGSASPNSPIHLRIKTRHRSVLVLPLISYSCLQHHLSQFHNLPISETTGDAIDSVQLLSSLDPWLNVKAKAELASSVVSLQQAIGQAPQFLVALILNEVKKQGDPNMVLRGNSFATKATEIYLRLVGETYLSQVLTDFVQTVLTGCTNDENGTDRVTDRAHTGKPPRHAPRMSNAHSSSISGAAVAGPTFPDCEVDTAKVQSSSQLTQNQAHLIRLVEVVWERIVTSESYFPDQLRLIFSTVRAQLDASFPLGTIKSSGTLQATLSEHVISACLFLRYLCPAILSPSLFGLTAEFPSEPRVLRAFTLVAKTIQSLANFSLFAGSKEGYMTFMNTFVSSQLPAMRRFLYAISSPPLKVPRSLTTSEALGTKGSLDGTASLTQSICVPSFDTGAGRILLTSQSHHGAFLCDPRNGNQDSFDDPTLLSRSTSGLPSGTVCDRSSSGTGLPDEQTSFAVQSDSNSTSQIPVLLPRLPRHNGEGQPGDHVDLALCLALCHLQLSEAVQKIPTEKTPPCVAKIRPVLEEIDFFLSSGVEPSANWWHQEFNTTNNRSNVPQTSTVSPCSNVLASSVASAVSPPIGSGDSETDMGNLAAETQSMRQAISNTPGQIDNHDNLLHSSVETGQVVISVQSGITNRVCARQNNLLRSPSQKVFIPPVSNCPYSVSHVVRSRSGSELVQGGSGGLQHAVHHLAPTTKHEHSIPAPGRSTNCYNDPSCLYSKAFSNYEQTPLPPPYSLSDLEERRSSFCATQQNVTPSILKNEDALWEFRDAESHLMSIPSSTADVLPSVDSRPSLTTPVIHAHDGHTPSIGDQQPSLTHMYATHSSSSGYQSLRSHDKAPTTVGNSSGPHLQLCDHQVTKDSNVRILSQSTAIVTSALAMSNPLYAFHNAHPQLLSPPLFNSVDSNGLPPQDPRSSPMVQARPMRVQTIAPRSARRHTYVNLGNGPESEIGFTSVQPTRRRASITSDPSVSQTSSPQNNVSPDHYGSLKETSNLTTSAPIGCNGSLGTLSSDPTESAIASILFPPDSTQTEFTNHPISPDADLARQVTTMHATVEGLDLGSAAKSGSLKSRNSIEKRTAVFQTDSIALDPESIRDELDASQARLAEAQARLLANEAERIQLLRAWHNELMKQSQLVTYGTRAPGTTSPRQSYESETFTIPRTSSSDQPGFANRRDTIPLTTNTRDLAIFDPSVTSSSTTYSLSRTCSRPLYGARPRMGASLIGSGYHDLPPGTHIPQT